MTDSAKNSNALKNKGNRGISYADKRREERQTALREYLQGQRYIQDIHADLENPNITEDQLPVIRYKTETRLKLLAKCLPDLARTELTGEDGNPIQVQDVPLIINGVAAKR